MKRKTWLVAAMGALVSGFLMAPAQAAPVSGVTGDLKIAATGETAGVQQAHYRHRHYRRHRHHYGFYPYWRRHHHHHHHRWHRRHW